MELGNEGEQLHFEAQYEHYLKVIPVELKRVIAEVIEDMVDDIAPDRDDTEITHDAWKQALEEVVFQFQKIEL